MTCISALFVFVVLSIHASDGRERRRYFRFSRPSTIVSATCQFTANEAGPINGRIDFTQSVDRYSCIPNNELQIRVRISGLNPTDGIVDHGLRHIHQFGDLGNGCLAAGPHFNPFNQFHGGRRSSQRRHLGDLGNVSENENGIIVDSFRVPETSIIGPRSVIGRAVVLHAQQDDLGLLNNEGSKTTGNSGSRLACCVIGRSEPRPR